MTTFLSPPYYILACYLILCHTVLYYTTPYSLRQVRAFAVPAPFFAPAVKHRDNISLVKLAWEADVGSSLDDESDDFFTDLDEPPRKATAFSTADDTARTVRSRRSLVREV